MVNFLRDPTGDIPWEEDVNGSDVFHIHDPDVIYQTIFRQILIFAY